jgi:hypothetical protein
VASYAASIVIFSPVPLRAESWGMVICFVTLR